MFMLLDKRKILAILEEKPDTTVTLFALKCFDASVQGLYLVDWMMITAAKKQLTSTDVVNYIDSHLTSSTYAQRSYFQNVHAYNQQVVKS